MSADEVVLLADASKFPGVGTATVCGPAALHRVITDAEPDLATVAVLREHGIQLDVC